MPLNVVITMAGRGSRFYEAGFMVPKYEIMAHGKSLFDLSLLSLKNFLSSDARVIFVCLKENQSTSYIRDRCNEIGLSDIHIVELDDISDGQATSAYISRDYWLNDRPLMIYNIDTYINPTALLPEKIRPGSDGWVPCFKALGNHWSFVKLGEDGWAIDLAEKQRISNFASTGLYWFANTKCYIEAYELFFTNKNNLVNGERYIAPLYKQIISEGGKVSITNLSLDDVHVLGTPKELEKFLELNRDVLPI